MYSVRSQRHSGCWWRREPVVAQRDGSTRSPPPPLHAHRLRSPRANQDPGGQLRTGRRAEIGTRKGCGRAPPRASGSRARGRDQRGRGRRRDERGTPASIRLGGRPCCRCTPCIAGRRWPTLGRVGAPAVRRAPRAPTDWRHERTRLPIRLVRDPSRRRRSADRTTPRQRDDATNAALPSGPDPQVRAAPVRSRAAQSGAPIGRRRWRHRRRSQRRGIPCATPTGVRLTWGLTLSRWSPGRQLSPPTTCPSSATVWRPVVHHSEFRLTARAVAPGAHRRGQTQRGRPSRPSGPRRRCWPRPRACTRSRRPGFNSLRTLPLGADTIRSTACPLDGRGEGWRWSFGSLAHSRSLDQMGSSN
jgi:hypothetical protein